MALDFQYDEMLLYQSGLRNLSAGDAVYGYAFDLMYPSYRGTFLSCIEKLAVRVDGRDIDAGDLRFTLNGKQFLISELPTLCHEHWFVLDRAAVSVLGGTGLEPGKHTVEVELVHRVPYTGYFGEYLVLTSKAGREFHMDQEARDE